MKKICLTRSELDAFATIFENPRRRALLRRVVYVMELPLAHHSALYFSASCVICKQALMDMFQLLSV